jgi:hypothetical protein
LVWEKLGMRFVAVRPDWSDQSQRGKLVRSSP